ncbi:hypothetical protein SAY87_029385 [Trapa incisa]|uniref:Uncharacterized protein n=1 Tax=Trapa incisa TaxID=236973 RepID=A0AAN7K7F6_9MYRT|nr:hypothetical protein SAY87_029385 [Trapa incisa]
MGLLGAVYVWMVLVAVMAAAVVIGIGLVRVWVDDPVVIKERLYFDYTEFQPPAMFGLCAAPGDLDRGSSTGSAIFRRSGGVCKIPVGHKFRVSVVLVIPDSDHNSLVGVFRVFTNVGLRANFQQTLDISMAATADRGAPNRHGPSYLEIEPSLYAAVQKPPRSAGSFLPPLSAAAARNLG